MSHHIPSQSYPCHFYCITVTAFSETSNVYINSHVPQYDFGHASAVIFWDTWDIIIKDKIQETSHAEQHFKHNGLKYVHKCSAKYRWSYAPDSVHNYLLNVLDQANNTLNLEIGQNNWLETGQSSMKLCLSLVGRLSELIHLHKTCW